MSVTRIIGKCMAAAGAVILLLPGFAGAADSSGFPCMEEIEKYCKDVQPGGGRILECLSGHDRDLTPVCRGKVDEHRRKMEEAKKICEADIRKFCTDVKPGQGRLLKCLQREKGSLTPECRKQVVKYSGKPAGEPVKVLPEASEPPSGKGGR